MASYDLQKFLDDWQKELSSKRRNEEQNFDHLKHNRTDRFSDAGDCLSVKRKTPYGHDDIKNAKKWRMEPQVPMDPDCHEILQLQSSQSSISDRLSKNANIGHSSQVAEKDGGKKPEPTLVDVLLADLDEINDIPFFDLTVPREVAMNIFQHFDMVDLCRCAQVSRSWKAMAEDELLWCRLCHKLGHELSTTTSERDGWKLRAKQLYLNDRKLAHNWKNRIGRYEELSYVPGGILCAADSLNSLVAGGYSSGQVCVWDVDRDVDAVYRPSSVALMLDVDQDRGTLANEITGVRLGQGVAAASYSQGIVDVWHLDGDVDPVHTSRSNATTCHVACHATRPTVAYSFGRSVSMIHVARQRDECSTLCTADFGQNISWLKFVPDCADLLCVQTGHLLRLVAPSMRREEVLTVHELVDSVVACRDVDAQYAAVGVTSYGLLDGCKIQVYQLMTGQLMTSLCGIGQLGLKCINVTDSPSGMVVSGGQDRRVYVHDYRQPGPVLTLYPDISLSGVQMDADKVVVNGYDGQTCVYDTRTGHKLWQFHNRHPVVYSHFDKHRLITANVPQCKQPDPDNPDKNMTHKRFRGGIHLYDFSVTNETEGVPTICKSNYDTRSGYSYNINLAVPYDQL